MAAVPSQEREPDNARAFALSPPRPTHLEAFTGTLAACAEKGRWQQCVPIAAALVGGDAGAAAVAFPEMLSRLSARDRTVYALNVPRYEAYLARRARGAGAPLDPLELTQNPLALRAAAVEGHRR